MIVDAENGEAYLRPGDEVVKAIQAAHRRAPPARAEFAKLRDTPAFTRDGAKITLAMNAGLDSTSTSSTRPAPRASASSAPSSSSWSPRSCRGFNAQTALYGRVMDAAGDRPVTFRTLDLGGDKVLPYWRPSGEDNPALGWRAIRMGLDRPALLRLQLRALIAAAPGRPLEHHVPAGRQVDEFRAAPRLVDLELAWARRRGREPPSRLDVGAMIEAPSLVWHLDALLPMTDFVIGRHQRPDAVPVRRRPRQPAVGRPLRPAVAAGAARARQTRSSAAETGTPVSVCGEMAGRPLEAMALIGLGVRNLSVSPSEVGPVKAMVRSLDAAALSRYLATLLDLPDHSLRGRLQAYAQDRGVVLPIGVYQPF